MKKIKLGDVCTINANSYSLSDDWDFVNYLDTSNISANTIENIQRIDTATEKLPSRARRKVQNDSIIYSTVRPNQRHYGIIKSQPKNFLVSTGFVVIDVNPEVIDANYLYYRLTQNEIVQHLQSIAEQSTTAYPSIKPSDLSNLEFWVPSLDEQKQIGNLLYSIDAKIALNTKIEDIDFYSLQLARHSIKKFESIVNNIKKINVIHKNEIGDFVVQITKRPYENAKEMGSTSGKKIAFADVFKHYYNGDAFSFLQKLKELDIDETEYYKYFSYIEYQILNKYGYEISGGERAEFNLLQEIDDATKYDMLLIDEPESSFDNIFLREKVNEIIRGIAKQMPVIVVTHNNTVGASIHPDFIIHTKRHIINQHGIQYVRYYGRPSDKILRDSDGNEINNIDVTLDCLEAGEKAYNERSRDYEVLRH